jgi:hypothetical protein
MMGIRDDTDDKREWKFEMNAARLVFAIDTDTLIPPWSKPCARRRGGSFADAQENNGGKIKSSARKTRGYRYAY